MKKIILIPLLLLSINVYAKTLSATSVSPQTLKELINSSEYDVKIEEDGDLKIENKSKIRGYIYIYEDRKMLRFVTSWRIAESVSENRLLRFLNKFSRDYIFSGVYADYEKKIVYLEYYLCYDGGIDSENLDMALYWVFGISESLRDGMNSEDIF